MCVMMSHRTISNFTKHHFLNPFDKMSLSSAILTAPSARTKAIRQEEKQKRREKKVKDISGEAFIGDLGCFHVARAVTLAERSEKDDIAPTCDDASKFNALC